jgi:hypothetical protein
MGRGAVAGFGARVGLGLALAALGCDEDEPKGSVDAVEIPDAAPAPVPNVYSSGGVKSGGTLSPTVSNLSINDSMQLAPLGGGKLTADGKATGNLEIQTPYYNFQLGKAQLMVEGARSNATAVIGKASVTMPPLHTFAGLGLQGPVSGTFGYDTGAALTSLGLPLAAKRRYLYFSYGDGFSTSFAGGAVQASGGSTHTLAIDPADPAIFLAGPMGYINAVALSEKGLIPYQPSTTWGFQPGDDDFPTFTGHTFLAGEIPLEEIPIVITGDVTTQFTGWNGRTTLDKSLYSRRLGLNGGLNLGWDFLDGAFRLEVPLAKAAVYLEFEQRPRRVVLAVSGTAKVQSFLPTWLPVLMSTQTTSVAGYLDTSASSRNHLDVASSYTIQMTELGRQIGLSMPDQQLADGTIHVDHLGFRFRGISHVGLTPQIAAADCIVTACFGGDPIACLSDDQSGTPVMGSREWIVRMEGDVTIAHVPLLSATALANSRGLSISSIYKTQVQQVSMTGAITAGGNVSLTGTAAVNLPLTAANSVVGAIVDGAACGYKVVTDAAKCGVDVLNFGDEFHCGKPHCSWSWKHGLRCSALSCSVKVPRTCKDLSKPKKCKPGVPAGLDLGSVEGSVAVSIKNDGITGVLSGKFCPKGGRCTSLSNVGTLNFSAVSAPEICIDTKDIPSPIPLTAGEFCAPF